MRRRLVLVALLLLIAVAPAAAQPTRVQTLYGHQQTGGTTCVINSGASTTTGNMLVLAAQWASTVATISSGSFAITSGTTVIGTPTVIPEFATSSVSSSVVWIPITTGGTMQLTMTLSGGSANCNLQGWELSGADPTSPINAHAGQRVGLDSNGADDPANGISSGSMTTTVNNCLILGMFSGNSQTLSAGTSNAFTLVESHSGTWGGYTEYWPQSTAGAVTADFTRTAGGAIGIAMQGIAVAPQAAATSGAGRLLLLGIGGAK